MNIPKTGDKKQEILWKRIGIIMSVLMLANIVIFICQVHINTIVFISYIIFLVWGIVMIIIFLLNKKSKKKSKNEHSNK